jgi:REP element-mobilizing transposase RayT
MEFFHSGKDIIKTQHNLSHWQQGQVPLLVTFRLADSLPQILLEPLLLARAGFLAAHPQPWDDKTEERFHHQFSDKLEEYLDVGHGSCALHDPQIANLVAERFHHFDEQRYHLWSYVIMPNHVHVLFTLHVGESLPDVVQGWKGVSSRLIHKAELSELNPFWQPDYFDRLIRSIDHFETVMAYIRENPVKARLRDGFVLWERR